MPLASLYPVFTEREVPADTPLTRQGRYRTGSYVRSIEPSVICCLWRPFTANWSRPIAVRAGSVLARMSRYGPGRTGYSPPTKPARPGKTATSPHGWPGPSISLTKERAARARSARPASVTHSRTATLAITHPPFRCPHQPGEASSRRAGTHGCTLDSARASSLDNPPARSVRGRP